MLEIRGCVAVQGFVRRDCAMIAAAVYRDIDGIAQRTHSATIPSVAGIRNAGDTPKTALKNKFAQLIEWPARLGSAHNLATWHATMPRHSRAHHSILRHLLHINPVDALHMPRLTFHAHMQRPDDIHEII